MGARGEREEAIKTSGSIDEISSDGRHRFDLIVRRPLSSANSRSLLLRRRGCGAPLGARRLLIRLNAAPSLSLALFPCGITFFLHFIYTSPRSLIDAQLDRPPSEARVCSAFVPGVVLFHAAGQDGRQGRAAGPGLFARSTHSPWRRE